MSSQIARLTTVAHILYDREVLELGRENARLRQENERLKQELNLKLFWEEHSIRELHEAMSNVIRRPDFDYILNNYEWMRPLIESCGLEWREAQWEIIPHNAHLVCLGSCLVIDYGTKLLKAKSVDDPELLKLKALFKVLKDMYDAPPTHATT
jgi:hypothetical protein